jgi:acetyl esterase/lipase
MRSRRAAAARAATAKVAAAIAASALVALAVAGCASKEHAPSSAAKPARAPEARVPQASKSVKAVKAPAGRPKGVMLIFSGGGWLASPPEEVAQTRHYAARYTALGWLTIDVGYRPGGEQGFTDVTRAYDKAKRDHPGLPICAVGESSGGHLALMLAIARPLTCVEPVDAPTDLVRGLPRNLEATAKAVFGKSVANWSPALRAHEIHGRVLIVHAVGDRIVPMAQARELRRRLGRGSMVLFPAGSLPFIHATTIDRTAYRAYLKLERAWLGSIG